MRKDAYRVKANIYVGDEVHRVIRFVRADRGVEASHKVATNEIARIDVKRVDIISVEKVK